MPISRQPGQFKIFFPIRSIQRRMQERKNALILPITGDVTLDTSIPDLRTSFIAEQFANIYPDGIQHHYWHRARNQIIVRRLGAYFKPSEQDVLLDIGCGRGITIEHFRKHGCNAKGCDLGKPAPISPEIGPHITVEANAFELPASVRQSVRCLTMLDVLEHFQEPREFLAKCLDAFPACEYVFVTLPARMEIWSNYDEYNGHFRRYGRSSARAMFDRPEFEVLDSGYFFHLLYVPALLMRCLHIRRSIVIAAPKSLAPQSLLTFYFNTEERLIPSFLPGSSIYLVARIVRSRGK